jgi:glycerophosphoryl diester phosphodiesterase
MNLTLLFYTILLSVLLLWVRQSRWKPHLFDKRDNKEFFIYGHRGAPVAAPENTLYSFKRAYGLNVDGIELDIQITQDGILVVRHDPHILDPTGDSTLISSLTGLEVSKVDARGGAFQNIPFQHIPTLEQVLQELPPNIIINIELKSQQRLSEGMERPLLLLLEAYDLWDKAVISCFNPYILWKIKLLDSRVKTALLWHGNKPAIKYWVHVIRPDAFHGNIEILEPDMVHWAQNLGMNVFAYTVNSEVEYKKAKQLGLTGIFTDNPGMITNE